MNNKKIIFGILLFVAISFIAYTFASPDDKEEGKMTYGNGTNEVNSPNNDKDNEDDNLNENLDDNLDNNEEDMNNEDDNEGIIPTPIPNPGNNNGSNSNRPSGGNNSSQTKPTPTPTPTPTPSYTVSVNVLNGSVNVGSQTVKKGNGASFAIYANNGYTLDGATISGGCALSGNTVSVSNVTGNMSCTVTLDTEKIYANVAALTDGISAKREDEKLIFSGTMEEQPKTNTCKSGHCIQIKLTSTKMVPAHLLNNIKITMGYSGRVYGIEALNNKDNALNQTERPYFTFNQEFKAGQTYNVTVDWGTGKPVTYVLDFTNVTVLNN